MGSVWLAIIYIGGWILSMRIFGYFWKNRKLAINDAEPWFGENIARSQYIALLQQDEPEATETQLTAALLRRAMEGVVRVLSMREDKQVLANLVKQGTVGDDIWTQFTLSEKELEAEIMAIVEEANTFKENWGQSILQTASEMVMHEKTKQMQKELALRREEEARKQAVRDQRKEKNKALKEKKEGTAAPAAAATAKESTTDAPAPAAAAEVETTV
ncbi:translocation protein S66 [Linnemannia schmuckeri]|uniref:Translocation protein S66 n=1 Tax=Linnemannia schmuckeri TaxID=64567 RepID=A0A9P5RZ99_9FUNG|nr:translocation protein S66 [Linnemannia schmuckeri]